MSKSDYLKLHYWIRKNLGKATFCSNDKNHKAKRYDWANISGNYKKDFSDYKSLCRSCHMKMHGYSEKLRLRSLGNHYRRRAILQLDLKERKMNKFNSIEEAGKKLDISRTAIINCLHNRAKTAGKYKWRYI